MPTKYCYPPISNLIRENKTYRIDSSIQTGKKLGMQLLDNHLWELFDAGKITQEEMLDKAQQPGMLQDKLKEKMGAMRGAERVKGKKEMDDMGPILRT